jgi:hypothetical protein
VGIVKQAGKRERWGIALAAAAVTLVFSVPGASAAVNGGAVSRSTTVVLKKR